MAQPPVSYADAALHDRYLRPLAAHADVMVVALNQVDQIDPLISSDHERAVVRRIVDDRRNLRDRFSF